MVHCYDHHKSISKTDLPHSGSVVSRVDLTESKLLSSCVLFSFYKRQVTRVFLTPVNQNVLSERRTRPTKSKQPNSAA